eukprot:sb/3472534/
MATSHLLFYTRHNTLKYHFHKMKLANIPTCRLCGIENETAKHLLTDCPTLWKQRQERFDRLGLTLDDIKNGFPITKTVSFFMDYILKQLRVHLGEFFVECPLSPPYGRQERFDRLGLTLDDIKNGFPITKTVSFFMDYILKQLPNNPIWWAKRALDKNFAEVYP